MCLPGGLSEAAAEAGTCPALCRPCRRSRAIVVGVNCEACLLVGGDTTVTLEPGTPDSESVAGHSADEILCR